jgi:hypothetical protein
MWRKNRREESDFREKASGRLLNLGNGWYEFLVF